MEAVATVLESRRAPSLSGWAASVTGAATVVIALAGAGLDLRNAGGIESGSIDWLVGLMGAFTYAAPGAHLASVSPPDVAVVVVPSRVLGGWAGTPGLVVVLVAVAANPVPGVGRFMSVVQLPAEAPPLLFAGDHDALTRALQRGGQIRCMDCDRQLRREIVEQLPLGRVEHLPVACCDYQLADDRSPVDERHARRRAGGHSGPEQPSPVWLIGSAAPSPMPCCSAT